jgi:putative ABC transport system permease protein
MGNVKVFLLSICAAVTFTVLLVSGNTMAMSVRERVREVGVLKTLGFTREAILGMILGEAVLLALLGGAIGILIAEGLCALMRMAPAFIAQLKSLTIHPLVGAACLAVAAVIGLVSSLVPAWGAANTPIVEALRRND